MTVPAADRGEDTGPLAAERAAVDHWRRIAQQRRREAAAVQRRPLVRAAIAADRRTRGLTGRATPAPPRVPRPGEGDPPPGDGEALAAERAGARYWREVAEQRRVEAATVQRRPLVRVAIAVDRRTRRLQSAAARAAGAARASTDRAALRAGGWRARVDGCQDPPRIGTWSRHTISSLRSEVGDRACLVGLAYRLALQTPIDTPRASTHRALAVLTVRLRPASASVTGTDEVVWPDATAPPADRRAALRAVDAAVAASDAAVVCLLGPATRETGDAIERLARVAADTGAVAGPIVVHPVRPWRDATAHDGRVRAAGLRVDTTDDGTPTLRHVGAGAGPSRVVPPTRPLAVTAAAVAVPRDAWVAVGGIGHSAVTDLDAAVVDLCLRLREASREVRIVPAAVVVDESPVRRRHRLRGPLADDGRAWRTLVEHHGHRLLPRMPGSLRVALSTATPSRKMAPTSGDWHFATDLARAFEVAGHRVVTQTEAEVDALRGRVCDVHLVLRGLAPVRRTPGQTHVLWVISHPEALTTEECDAADLVLVASRRFAEDLRSRTTTPVEVMWQATDPDRCAPGPVDPDHRHPVTVVANTRGVRRAAVDGAIAAALTPAIHGQGWDGLVDPELVCSDYVAPDALPGVYRSAELVLNDHWETMRRWGFVSNRILDVLACGTPVVSDHLPEIPELFDDLVPTWTDPDDLARIVEDLRRDPDRTAARAAEARRRVLAHHTFAHRVDRLVTLLRDHALVP